MIKKILLYGIIGLSFAFGTVIGNMSYEKFVQPLIVLEETPKSENFTYDVKDIVLIETVEELPEIEVIADSKSGLTYSAKDVTVEPPPEKGNPLDRPVVTIPAPFNPPAITEVNPQ